ncbi:acyl-CoA dehydrogenase family protein [Ornithinimicrobium sufpigmenti]|uniref:acyl-CoA dehydrogenase family protein n=1 Tax=Ornithinimicrobium sufpigmenti TaxID=2508882 RepID=UPI001035EE42|nr:MULTISPECIES: acyl-CoA dehydrogenase family protein [unclassified Ornithinimicrobium]
MTTVDTTAASHDLAQTREEVLASVREILPLLASRADEAERNRRVDPEVFAALVDSGALRLFVPRRFGGLEAGYRTYLEVAMEVSAACGSSGWFTFILNHGDWHIGQMAEAAQNKVWANGPGEKVIVPLTPAPGFTAERVEGGTVLSGQWPYSSGSDHAVWGAMGFPVFGEDGAPVDNAIGLVRLAEAVEVKDTWFVSGMAGTSSNTVVLKDVFVPDELTITFSELMSHQFRTPFTEESQYQQDAGVVFHFATLAPVIGLARGAYESVLKRITSSPKPMAYTFYSDTTKSAATQAAMARASWLIETALQQARATADAIDAQAATGTPFSSLERARFAMAAAEGHKLCREAMDLVLDVNGAGSFALVNPLQRMFRDLHVASRHGMSVPGLKHEVYGRALLGASEQQMTPMV